MVKKATQVMVFGLGGAEIATKFRYRCRDKMDEYNDEWMHAQAFYSLEVTEQEIEDMMKI